MVLNAMYVCLHAFLLRRESLDPDPRKRTLISEVVMSQQRPCRAADRTGEGEGS
jgi:hypothetical protein